MIFYFFFFRLSSWILLFAVSFLLFTGHLALPEDAPINYDVPNGGFDMSPPADIVPGVSTNVPAAHPDYNGCWSVAMDVGIEVADGCQKDRHRVMSTHWGYGICLLNRDRFRIEECLQRDLRRPQREVSTDCVNELLRGFFPGRSYVRLYFIGSRTTTRLEHYPFVFGRLQAMRSEWIQVMFIQTKYYFLRIPPVPRGTALYKLMSLIFPQTFWRIS